MKSRPFTIFVLVVSLTLLMIVLPGGTSLTSAQRSEPPNPSARVNDLPLARHGAAGQVEPQSVNAPTVALGQPGLSFRHVQTFGTTEVAYISDTAHVNYPFGVGTDGANVWIADSMGLRALKYTNAGVIIQQIGKAGFRYGTGQSLNFVADVAVDSGGNIWLVDANVNHILKFDSSGNYVSKLGQSYSSGTDNSRFNGPESIAFDGSGNIYVSDRRNHRIQIFDSGGTYIATIGVTNVAGSDNAHFDTPEHIAIDNSNLLYVTDYNNHRVQIFNVSNPLAPTYMATIGVSGTSGSDNAHFENPAGVAVDASRIYVADENNYRVQVFDRATRAYQATISDGWGNDNDHLRHPMDVAVDSAGNIYVADFLNARVQQFNSSLVYVRTYGTTDVPYLTDNYHYNKPSGMAVAPDGSMYLTEEAGQRLIKLNAAGVPQWKVGQAGVIVDSDDNAHLNYPTDVALAPSGLIYVADAGNNRIQIFNPDGSYYGTLGTGYGTGNYQFKDPNGLFITPNGAIYVADNNNHRVQIYNSSRVYVATMGETGVPGADNAHFRSPNDVVVDANGNIYVSENDNYRVQMFNASRAYVRTIGVTGVGGDGFGYLNGPDHLAVDARNNLYVASTWNHAVHVFDQNGAYLTTLGESRGNQTGQLADPHGLALDSAGNLYIADYNNARIQKFAPGVPGWVQTNINGFGDQSNPQILTLAPFTGSLYAGTYNRSGNGAQLWRTTDGVSWTAVMTNGLGDPTNRGIVHLAEFNGNLYAGTYNWDNAINNTHGGQILRSSNGLNWTSVVTQGFGDPLNGEIEHLAVSNNQIYATTWSFTTTRGAEIWRSSTGNTGNWTRVVTNGFGNANNVSIIALETLGGDLYAGTYNWNSMAMTTTGATVWRTNDGATWTQVSTPGLGDTTNWGVSSLAAFNSYLYAGISGPTGKGSEAWRCQICDGSDWMKVMDNGFGNSNNTGGNALVVFSSRLYMFTTNSTTGMEVWRTADGTNWEQVGFAGFGRGRDGSCEPPPSRIRTSGITASGSCLG